MHDFIHCHDVIGRHEIPVKEVLAEEELTENRLNILLPILRVRSYDPNGNEDYIGENIGWVEEVNQQLPEHPTRIAEAWVIEVEDEHVRVDDVLE